MRKSFLFVLLCGSLVLTLAACASSASNEKKESKRTSATEETEEDEEEEEEEQKGEKESKFEFDRPDTVRGIYLTGHSAGGGRLDTLLDLVNDTDLNSMVIDIKDDDGNITYEPDEESDFAQFGEPYIDDPEEVLEELQDNDVYPIARIVVFKDSEYADENPDASFKSGEEVWRNGKDEAFVSPFKEEVWEYNLAIAKEAAEMGFQEIQFDYVRFPEGFENRADELSYDKGNYEDVDDDVDARVDAVTDFVAYAEDELDDYGVNVGVDVFGYTAAAPNAPGIGQDLVKIGEHIDVLSSMIYPSHWGEGSLDIDKPDLEPYETVFNYTAKEKEKLFAMEDPPVSRPWIQDFTASWLGEGNYKNYGKDEVEAQIRALNEAGIDEYLLWNAGNEYTENVDYKPSLDDDVLEKVKKDDKELRKKVEEEQKKDENSDEEDESDQDSGKKENKE